MKYSILITVYNKEKYIERCLDFACNQTYKNYEVIVVNDGSTDNSDQLIKAKQKQYHFRYYLKENGGVADTRNYIIQKVETPYFLFCDADDYLDLNCLETLEKYSDYDYDILSFNARFYKDQYEFSKNIIKPNFKGRGEDFFAQICFSEFMAVPWGLIYKTSFFRNGKFKYNKGYLLDDFCVTPFVLLSAPKLLAIDYIGYYYFEVPNSIMTKKGNDHIMYQTYEHFYDQLMHLNDEGNYSNEGKNTYRRSLIYTMLWVGENLKGKAQIAYIKRLKKKHVYDFLKNDGFTGKLNAYLMDYYLYYPYVKLKKLVKKIPTPQKIKAKFKQTLLFFFLKDTYKNIEKKFYYKSLYYKLKDQKLKFVVAKNDGQSLLNEMKITAWQITSKIDLKNNSRMVIDEKYIKNILKNLKKNQDYYSFKKIYRQFKKYANLVYDENAE